MDKSWMELDNTLSPEYIKGVQKFIDFAWRRVNKRERMACPCEKCNNVEMKSRADVEADLIINGIVKSYTTWHLHGEEISDIGYESEEDCDNEYDDDMIEMIQEAYGGQCNDWEDGGINEDGHTEPSGEADKFYKLLEDAKQKLYPGCENYSKLSFIVKLLHLKVLNKWTDKSLTLLLEFWKDVFPHVETIPNSYYEARKVIRDLGLGYVKIDACLNDCMLFWKQSKGANLCNVCSASRWKSDGVVNKNKVAVKTMRYFPLKPRLQRLFMSSRTAKDMTWHHKVRVDDGVLRHPADSKAWKDFDACHPLFGSDPRSVRLGLASDGFNPFGSMSTNYSTWPVILAPYNLPPWMCLKQPYTMLSLLIPGPKAPGNDIDVYLQPLIEELKELWDVGAETYDAFSGQNFTMRAAILWTINDFPTYANLSGWSTRGKLACPSCNINTITQRLYHGSKFCYMGHRRWLPPDHKWRSNEELFNKKKEYRAAPEVLSGYDVLEQLRDIEQVTFGKVVHKEKVGSKRKHGKTLSKRKQGVGRSKKKSSVPTTNWKKRSIFFELPYWRTLLIRHNLDVMHIEKNVCESVVSTLLNIDGKSKDNANSRRDLALMEIRSDLHLKEEEGKVTMPAACYTMSSKEKEYFCQFLKDVKVPDGFSSNLSRCAQPKERKIIGMKSHDYHVLMQQLLPLAIRGLLPHKVCEALTELSNFFKGLCSKVLRVDELERLESQVAITLCKLEMIFPPSFFDVMEHLLIHLASEAKLAGPVHYRWNYFVERNLRTLKSYVRNKSRPEGSIAEGYLAEECLTFCSRYLNEIETKFNRPERNYDRCNAQTDINLSAFRQSGRPLGKPTHQQLCLKELEQARLYVLQNCEEVIPYIEEHQQLVQSEVLHKEQFVDWFERRVTQMHNEGSDKVGQELLSLARGPNRNVRSFKGYIVNGFRFHTVEREAQRKTQNSGVKVAGDISNEVGASSMETIEYYGVLRDVIALQYLGGHQIVLFKCDWWDIFRKGIGIYKDKQGFTSVNFSKTIATNEPFVLACQAEQVFYVKDNIRKGWQIVVKTYPRDFYNMPPPVVDDEYQPEDDNEDPIQQNECFNLDVLVDDVVDQDKWARHDIDDIIVPN